ncbi:MAG: TonB-dependent receptor [Roseateles asaccharophilus]|uniref:TonB-dependent receptor n=1 Tax=Roseateles asaccharophilus TaxID=582607 RepID=UPI00391C13D0
MKLNQLARSLALVGMGVHVAGMAWAQSGPEVKKVERVEVTGSSIKRLASEGALPVQIISAAELNRKGITTAEQMLSQMGVNGTGADSAVANNNVFGSDTDRLTGGSANANLRGLGPGSTLVLLNGRRVSTHGMSGGAVDLNAIPMAAVARVEVLKDGASAIYGTDAIGGVINFILKKDMQGVDVGVNFSQPLESGGGTKRRASITGGFGNLDRDRFNVLASLALDKDDILRGNERSWANGFQPDRYLSPDSSSHPFANVINVANTALGATGSTVGSGDATRYTRINALSLKGSCDAIATGVQYQPQLWNASAAANRYLCNTDYGRQYMLAPPKDAFNLVTRGSFLLSDSHTAFVELTASRTESKAELTPAQFSTTTAAGNHYPVNGPHYLNLKSAGVNDFDPTKSIAYRWRMQDFGNRVIGNVSDNQRLATGLDGDIGAYAYKLGLSTAKAKAWSDLIDGYAYTAKLNEALKTGLINPWVKPGEKQSQAAMDLIESTKARGRLMGGETTLTQFDGSISGGLMALPAGSLDFAAGFDLRREGYKFAPEPGAFNCVSGLSSTATATDVLLCPGNSAIGKQSRDIKALYAELAVPVFKGLDLQLALRHDRYSDVGSTTNPKIAFRFQPNEMVLLRGSVNTGFKAPSFQQLAPNTAPLLDTSDWRDPELCPTVSASNPNCTRRLDYIVTGKPDLKPEKSTQGTIGIVFSPLRDLSFYADYWRVDLDERLRKLTLSEVKNNYALFKDRFARDSSGRVSLVTTGWENAADSSTKGLDWGGSYLFKHSSGTWRAGVNGTYMISHKERALENQPLQELVGQFALRTLYLRNKLSADIGWARDNWAATLTTIYKSGYMDQDMTRYGTPRRKINDYTTANLFASYTGFKNTTITAGLNNLFDKAPPFTYHNVDDVVGAGWDPRVGDPFGRTLSVSVNYSFR